jgi:RNA-dependent RNA polymerase
LPYAYPWSKTIKLQVDIDSVQIERIEDIPFLDENGSVIFDEDGKPLLHTDGTCYISKNLAMQCSKGPCGSKYMKDDDFLKIRDFEDVSCQQKGTKVGNMEPPLVMQVRLFYNSCAAKGTLLVNKKRNIILKSSFLE